MDNKFSSDFPDFINEETLIKASLPPEQTHPHQFSEILPFTPPNNNNNNNSNNNNNNNNNNNSQTSPTKAKRHHQENAPNKNQSNKNTDKGHQNHNKAEQQQTADNLPKLDPTKIVNRSENSHDNQHQKRQKQQHQKQQQRQTQQQTQQQQQQHQNQNQNTPNQHQSKHGKKTRMDVYIPDQDNNRKENRSQKKPKNKNNPNSPEKNNNSMDIKKVEQTVDTMKTTDPTVFYSFNCYLSAAFNSETQDLYTYDRSNILFNQNQLNHSETVTSFILLDEGTYVYSTSRGVFVYSRIENSESFYPLPNVTEIRPDYTNDKSHFFVLSDSNLYICQYHNKQIYTCLLHKNVIDFDFSKMFRVIVKKKGIRLYKRTDFKSFPFIKKDFKTPTAVKVFCDDDYMYEFSKGQVIPYLILLQNNQLKRCDPIKNVINVFSSDEVTIIIDDNGNNNNNNINRIPLSFYKIQIKEQTYEVKQLPKNVIINDGVISIWTEFDFPPIWLQIPDLLEKQNIFDANFIKETAEGSINVIKALNKSYNDYTEKINGLIKQSILFINQSFDKLKVQMNTLNSKIAKVEEIAMNTGATPQMCLDLYKKDVDRAFRAAAHYSINNLIALCGNNRFNESLQNNRISDETLIEIAEVFTDNFEKKGYSIVPYFVDLLLYFDPENEIFKARIKPLTSTILSATIGLFPTIDTSDPNYMNLRRLAHITMSLQNS